MTDGLWTEARKAVQRCAISYVDPSDHFANEQILITETDRIIVTIAGSNDIWDWIQNLNTDRKKLGDVFISEGVLDAAQNVVSMVVDYRAAAPWARAHKPVQYEGHSKGGAVAQAAAMLEHIRGFAIQRVITFAAPRITTDRIEYPFPCDQFEAFGDPIPFAPPILIPWRTWKHNGRRIRIGTQTMGNRSREWFGWIGKSKTRHVIANYESIFGVSNE